MLGSAGQSVASLHPGDDVAATRRLADGRINALTAAMPAKGARCRPARVTRPRCCWSTYVLVAGSLFGAFAPEVGWARSRRMAMTKVTAKTGAAKPAARGGSIRHATLPALHRIPPLGQTTRSAP